MKEKDKYFLDSNIWLYSFIESKDKQKTKQARELIKHIDNDIVISTQVINEVCVNLIKKLDFDAKKVNSLIEAFFNKYQVIEINKQTLLLSVKLKNKFNFSYWDSQIVSTALQGNCKYLISEDMHNKLKIEKVLTIINPFETDFQDLIK